MEPNEQEIKTLSLPEAMALAIDFHVKGRLAEAEKVYLQILAAMPENPDALHFLGALLHQRGLSDSGLDLIKRSVELAPQRADWYNDLGNVLFQRGEFLEATEAFRKSIGIDPGDANVWNNLGTVLQRREHLDEAASAFQKAIGLNPDFVDALNNFGNLLSIQGKVIESVDYLCKAFVLGPSHSQSKIERGIAFYKLGRIEEAAEVYRQLMIEQPDNPTARHLYAACSGKNVPDRASDAYVESTFDKYAENFDTKLGKLSYRGPEMIAEALAKVAKPEQKFNCLDAGCGTGLCGLVVAPYISRLTGVDLSARMLSMAAKRGVYNELVKEELTSYLSRHSYTFDLIVSADTLIYFGALEELLKYASIALRADGIAVLTAEEAGEVSEPGFRLNPHGRYSHSRKYLNTTLTACGLEVLAMQSDILRVEWDTPVNGLVVTARKTAKTLL
ncbi:MAG: tetratricopeptide repeat protein [Nitrospirae bacterium]|nr:tetratricopeptide repeat protein [Nitrospirota bacterium]